MASQPYSIPQSLLIGKVPKCPSAENAGQSASSFTKLSRASILVKEQKILMEIDFAYSCVST